MQLNIKKNKIKKPGGGVPGSSEVKNPSANAEYTGSTWHRRIPQPVEQLSLHHSYGAPPVLEPVLCSEKPMRRNQRGTHTAMKTQHSQK